MTVFAAAFQAPVYSLQLLICPLPRGSESPPLELRGLFEQFLREAG
jgi:hypothetical protein